MNETFAALGHLFLQSVPTIVFFIILTIYLDRVFFKPMSRILEKRREATDGVRQLAQQAFEAAEKKGSELEHALQIARSQLHQEHEAMRRQWSEEQARAIADARQAADREIQNAKREIAAEAERAEHDLAAQVDELSNRIQQRVLTRRAA
jgi:F-type H+-transporting ATPase subunit b